LEPVVGAEFFRSPTLLYHAPFFWAHATDVLRKSTRGTGIFIRIVTKTKPATGKCSRNAGFFVAGNGFGDCRLVKYNAVMTAQTPKPQGLRICHDTAAAIRADMAGVVGACGQVPDAFADLWRERAREDAEFHKKHGFGLGGGPAVRGERG
jgi:hypothetical protein